MTFLEYARASVTLPIRLKSLEKPSTRLADYLATP